MSFQYRGFMLDVCRHFMPKEDILRLLRGAAALGLNRMHWHLTDDQGWRIEIRAFPKLTSVGAFRGPSCFGGVSETEHNDGFYTREDIREVVAAAGELGISVIPEIEIPGHAAALLAAYPEFGCRRGSEGRAWPNRVEVSAGIFPALLCGGRDDAEDFLRAVLDEVTELFPFPAVHIGGDEALKIRWRRCPDCQARMRAEGIPSEDALQRRLVLRVGEYLAAKGRRTIVWNDVLAGGPLPPHFIVQQWTGGEEATRAFMENGGDVIWSDTEYFYLDYAYGTTDVKKIWSAPRIPAFAKGLEDRLLGVECPLWTEYISNMDQAARQLFPRLTAAALKAAGADGLSWPAFRNRVRAKQAEIDALGLRGAPEELWAMDEAAAAADREDRESRIREGKAGSLIHFEEQLVLLDRTERFMREIGIPETFLLRAGDIRLAELYDEPAPEGPEDGADALIRQLSASVESRAWGDWARFPEDIWLATMRCFPRFIGEHRCSFGWDGFDRDSWTVRQVEARLFRIGELEYELAADTPVGPAVSVHIPSDARLEADILNRSVAEARAFLREYFPGWSGRPMVCESWLLSPRLKELLPPDSRILRFQAAFDLRSSDPEDDAALEWVFHVAGSQRAAVKLETLPEDTSLQRRLKVLLLRGEQAGSGFGILKETREAGPFGS